MRDGVFNYKFAIEKTVEANNQKGYIAGIATTPTLDSYDDIIAAGAFEESIKTRGVTGPGAIKMLAQHDSRHVIGNWSSLKYEGDKLKVEGVIDIENVKGLEYYNFVKKDQVGSLSVGFRTQIRQWDEDYTTRTIIKGDLREVSLVTFPANEDAVITQVKSDDVMRLCEIEKLVVKECNLSRKQSQALIRVIRASGLLASATVDPASTVVTIPPDEENATKALNELMESMKAENALRQIRSLADLYRAA